MIQIINRMHKKQVERKTDEGKKQICKEKEEEEREADCENKYRQNFLPRKNNSVIQIENKYYIYYDKLFRDFKFLFSK